MSAAVSASRSESTTATTSDIGYAVPSSADTASAEGSVQTSDTPILPTGALTEACDIIISRSRFSPRATRTANIAAATAKAAVIRKDNAQTAVIRYCVYRI